MNATCFYSSLSILFHVYSRYAEGQQYTTRKVQQEAILLRPVKEDLQKNSLFTRLEFCVKDEYEGKKQAILDVTDICLTVETEGGIQLTSCSAFIPTSVIVT
jgi:hypothetical protein